MNLQREEGSVEESTNFSWLNSGSWIYAFHLGESTSVEINVVRSTEGEGWKKPSG